MIFLLNVVLCGFLPRRRGKLGGIIMSYFHNSKKKEESSHFSLSRLVWPARCNFLKRFRSRGIVRSAGEPILQGLCEFRRRVCPGKHSAQANVWIELANLLQ
jgi:hypothetical protein